MVSVAEGAESAGESEGLGPSGRRPEPGAAGVLDARPCSPRSSAPERPGCPGRPPGSERRCSEQRGSACALCLGFPAGCEGALGAPRGAVCSPPFATSGGEGTLWPGRAFGSTESLLGGGKRRVAALE
ncbi:unnamed protein product [Rangifer tarandus platyrhynchus]|uniref:Uncharacterized protein n=2 Tax=Rangifer tarandus platyrhynchus TaxID=3082113 RepID=A0ABN8ZJG6_RANTA|nr:unnamed protein product [Rangifer tarandus platyrhynchus]CAI9709264.1 unnamed protein product [Rangifer tarandus platyrhynchus]